MTLDPRLNAIRSDLADARLKGRVDRPRFAEGDQRQVTAPVCGIHAEPRGDASLTSQALFGELVTVFDLSGGWAWCQADRDAYVGYIHSSALTEDLRPATHRVNVLTTFAYPQAGIKTQPAAPVYLNSEVAVTDIDGAFARLADGRFVWAGHLCPLDRFADDPATVAARFAETPYLWGGKSAAGIDCSGLVQMSFAACGRACPRDSDMMAGSLGNLLQGDGLSQVMRGDLVFWNGHVAMMLDDTMLVHANGYHMATVIEPLDQAVERIGRLFGAVAGVRRP